jgi:FAD/FMN-containing dehydrogenase
VNPAVIPALKTIVGDAHVFTDPRSLEVFSRDHSWFSPILVDALRGRLAEVVVAPWNTSELLEVMRLAVQFETPLTVRGAGTGNYGQAVPLRGGILANLHRLNRILEIDAQTGVARIEAGVRMGALERRARELGWELRIYPSTWATCTFGGFVGGGFGGVGSINHGTLWDGNVLAAEVIPMTDDPQPLELTGWDCAAVIHAYGTTAVMTELSVPLARAQDWCEAVLSFPSLERAIACGHALAISSINKRELSINEDPIPAFFTPLVQENAIQFGQANILLEVAAGDLERVVAMLSEFEGTLDWQRAPEDYHRGNFALTDFTWNHTTLWALKTDPTLTYLQARFTAERVQEQVRLLKDRFGDEIMLHLEFIRENLADNGGTLVAASLPIVRYTTRERLYEMVHYCEEIGVQIADPHAYYLDEDSRWNGQAVLEAVARFNPRGLLNPGKIKQLETGEIGVQASSWFAGSTLSSTGSSTSISSLVAASDATSSLESTPEARVP